MKATVHAGPPPPSFGDYLRQELARRCARNKQYSLRAFATYLGVHHSTLSQILRGKRSITRAIVEKFGFRLGLASEAVEQYIAAEAIRPKHAATEANTLLARDTAELLEDWRNFAILELTRLADFQPDSRWIARMLGIAVDEVNIALSRLCRLGLLRMEGGSWKDQLGDAILDIAHFQQAALRNFLNQVLPVHTGATIAIPSDLVPAAGQRIAAFAAEFLHWLEQQPAKDEVYRFEIRFAPLTRR
ncbi:MAG: TIGR02147 family protein [Bryobacterales bacterium]|nr:TIGR02147 family protein [Bryobacterales bacterium]